MRRSKTPTALMGSVRSKYTQDATNGNRGLFRAGSSGRLAKQSTQTQDGNDKVVLRKSSTPRGSPGSNRVKRPSSSYEDAGIFSNNINSPSPKGQEVKKSGRSNSLAVGGASKRSHSSMGYSNVNPRSPSPTTSSHSSSLLSSQDSAGKTPSTSKPTKFISQKSRSASIESQSSRPGSATACYQVRRGSGTKGDKPGSNPSSGRSTPVNRGSVGGKEGTDGGVLSSRIGTGLPPRTPYR